MTVNAYLLPEQFNKVPVVKKEYSKKMDSWWWPFPTTCPMMQGIMLNIGQPMMFQGTCIISVRQASPT
jgi:hypothetical protein